MSKMPRRPPTTGLMRLVERAYGQPLEAVLRERHAALGSYTRVAAELGVSAATTHAWYRRFGLPLGRRAVAGDDHEVMRELRELGLAGPHTTLRDLAVALRPHLAGHRDEPAEPARGSVAP